MSESDTTTTTTAPAPPPSYSSETVTRKVVNPPPVVVNPPATTETETSRTENMVPDRPAPSMQEKKESSTTFSPLGISHSETKEKTSD